jgi:hypothetical protein
MKRNVKGEVAAIATVGMLSAFLLLKHSNLSSFIPFQIPFISHAATQSQPEYVPVGKMVLDGDYELGPDWMLHMDNASSFLLSKKGKQIYSEEFANANRSQPVLLSGSGLNGYVKDLTNSGQSDFVIEQQRPDSTSRTGESYTYTIYTLGDNGVTRHFAQELDGPAVFKDAPTKGLSEEVWQDSSFTDFGSDKHVGSKEEVLLQWNGGQWEFSQSLMKQNPLKPAELNKLAADIDSKIIRYDTPTADNAQAKRLEIHPNAWQPLVHMIYHGDSWQAWNVLDRVWKNNETALLDDGSKNPITKEEFWNRIWKRVKQSPYGEAIRAMNGVTD